MSGSGPDLEMHIQNLEGFPPERGAQNCLFSGVFYNDIASDLSLIAIIARKKGYIEKRKKICQLPRVPDILSKFGELWPTNV